MGKMYDKIKKCSKTYARIGMISASLLLAAVPVNVQADVASNRLFSRLKRSPFSS